MKEKMKKDEFYHTIDSIHYSISQLNKFERELWKEYGSSIV